MQSPDYFINNNKGDSIYNKLHFWEPHTSSIDFCKTNYLHSSYIVEPHNVFSSLWGLSAIGFIGIYFGNPTNELRFQIAYGILILIGLGSAALHGTLHWIFQSSDELPMIYLVLSAVYCCLELGDDTVQKDKLKYPWLPYFFVALGIINTFVYFRFQQMYIVFLMTFVGLTMVGLTLHVQTAWKQRQILVSTEESSIRRNNAQVALRFYIWHYIVFIFIAAPVWVLDQFWCKHLIEIYDNTLPFFLKGCTLHVIWHAMAGLGAHTILQFLIACRMSILGLPCAIRWVFVIPVVINGANIKQS